MLNTYLFVLVVINFASKIMWSCNFGPFFGFKAACFIYWGVSSALVASISWQKQMPGKLNFYIAGMVLEYKGNFPNSQWYTDFSIGLARFATDFPHVALVFFSRKMQAFLLAESTNSWPRNWDFGVERNSIGPIQSTPPEISQFASKIIFQGLCRWWFQHFFVNFHSECLGKWFPIWLAHIFQTRVGSTTN